MASITINNLSSAADINRQNNNVLPIYQGTDGEGDTYKITPKNLVNQVLDIPSSGGNATMYLNQTGKWSTPANTTYADVTTTSHGLLTAADKIKLNNLTTALATEDSRGYLEAADKIKLNNLTTSVASPGKAGLLPALPTTSASKVFLDGTGNWKEPPGSTYAVATTSKDGLMSKTAVSNLEKAFAHSEAKGSSFAPNLYKIQTNAQGHVTGTTAVTKNDITNLGIPGNNTTYAQVTSTSDGLMSSADKASLDQIKGIDVATISANGYMSKEDKAKANKIDNVWRWRYHDSVTGTGIKFSRYGDIVFFTYMVNDKWGNTSTYETTAPYYRDYDIPVGFRPHPVMNGQTAYYGGLYEESTTGRGVKSILRGSTRERGTKFRVEIGNRFTDGTTVSGQGELSAMWIADNSTANAPSKMTGIEASIEKVNL